LANLQIALSNNGTVSGAPILDIDDVTTTALTALQIHYNEILPKVPDFCIETDINLQHILIHSKIKHLCQKNKVRSNEVITLTRRGIDTIQQALNRADDSLALALNTFNPILRRHIQTIRTLQLDPQTLTPPNSVYLYDSIKCSMVRAVQLSSKNIRHILGPKNYLNNTKMLNTTVDKAISIYKKISSIRSIQSRNKVLRLVHGDVYCGARLKKFHLSDNDRCIRCFNEETTIHLLLECPYTKEVWIKLGINPTSLCDILDGADMATTELLSYLLSEIVFRKKILPTDILIRTMLTSFSNGLCRSSKVIDKAKAILHTNRITGSWNIT
jgi:hypothetical protein